MLLNGRFIEHSWVVLITVIIVFIASQWSQKAGILNIAEFLSSLLSAGFNTPLCPQYTYDHRLSFLCLYMLCSHHRFYGFSMFSRGRYIEYSWVLITGPIYPM